MIKARILAYTFQHPALGTLPEVTGRPVPTLDEDAQDAKVGRTTLMRAKAFMRRAPKPAAGVESDEVEIKDAYEIGEQRPDVRRRALATVRDGRARMLVVAVEDQADQASRGSPPPPTRPAPTSPKRGTTFLGRRTVARLRPRPSRMRLAPTPNCSPRRWCSRTCGSLSGRSISDVCSTRAAQIRSALEIGGRDSAARWPLR